MMPLEQVFQEFIKHEYPLIKPEGEQLRVLRKAFFSGVWVAMGFFQKSNSLPNNLAIKVVSGMLQETKAALEIKGNTHIKTKFEE
jgi:hypothetical protein